MRVKGLAPEGSILVPLFIRIMTPYRANGDPQILKKYYFNIYMG